MEEIQDFGGEVLAVAGDVGADDFPKKIVDATVQCVFHVARDPLDSGFFSTSSVYAGNLTKLIISSITVSGGFEFSATEVLTESGFFFSWLHI